MPQSQPGVLAPVAPCANYMTLSLATTTAASAVLERVRDLRIDESIVVGIGEPLVRALGKHVEGLHTFRAISGAGPAIPSTQAALFVHTRAKEHAAALTAMLRVVDAIGDAVRIEEDVAAAKHDIGRDLSGYEDGTENPKGEDAVAAAITSDGSSFVAVQRWIHDLRGFGRIEQKLRDQAIGRDLTTNEELPDPPRSAHTKRSEQESYDPPAFMVRRSMPYGTVREHGLYFVAFVAALSTFERVMVRMSGIEDGIVDGLFTFSRPVSGGYYWCPPVTGGRLDLRALGY